MKQSDTLFEHISQFCWEHNLITPGSTIVVGLSGGPDSVFLLHYLAALREKCNLTLVAAHLDHGWRTESASDAEFCQKLAAELVVPLIIKNLKDAPVDFKYNGSQEELGRKARRGFFEQVAQEYQATRIALAHHADDQMETFIIRLIRGASLSGLAGIKAHDGLYIRPLLLVSKQEILDYLHVHQMPYIIDASNQSDRYLRNRIRNSVIPALKCCDDRFEKNFAQTHAKLVDTEEFLQELSHATLETISDENNSLDINKLIGLHPVLRNRVLINWLIMHKVPFAPSAGLLDEIVRFLENNKATTHTLYQKWQLIKNNNRVSLLLL